MPRTTTFGFEAEFQQNANAAIIELHALGLAGTNRLHGYHCDCEHCEFGVGWAFRGQTDSSCSGEIISDICTNAADGRSWMEALEGVAVDVDAEPGTNSGFHVHVGIGDITSDQRADILWQFLRWEHVLERVAGGRWTTQRSGMNRTVKACLSSGFETLTDVSLTIGNLLACETEDYETSSGYDLATMKRWLVNEHIGSDRHSNLNIGNRRHPTWEFRLWNSTRVAWRMELFTGLSVAFVDPAVTANLAELTPPQRLRMPASGVDLIALACADAGHDRTAELIVRQMQYLNDRALTAPSLLTAL